MVIAAKVKGFICTTAHPDGCRENVLRQIACVRQNGKIEDVPKIHNALIIGSSTGYGLASRITAAFGLDANTLGIMFERPATPSRTATPGYYNTKAFETAAAEAGLYAATLNKDAFSAETKREAAEIIRKDMGRIDLVIYSLAAPKRTMADGTVYTSVLKTTGEAFTNKSWNLKDNSISPATIGAAQEKETEATVKVMGGEDWMEWIDFLHEENLLSEQVWTVAYSYIGPEFTYPVYRDGTIGAAKRHLEQTAAAMRQKYAGYGLEARVSVNKALVTQASAAIPIVPLYFAALYKVMKAKGIHEGCIQQIDRLFRSKLFAGETALDENGLFRMDDLEMRTDVQEAVMNIWEQLQTGNVESLTDVKGYWEDFYHIFGFGFPQIDYEKDVNHER